MGRCQGFDILSNQDWFPQPSKTRATLIFQNQEGANATPPKQSCFHSTGAAPQTKQMNHVVPASHVKPQPVWICHSDENAEILLSLLNISAWHSLLRIVPAKQQLPPQGGSTFGGECEKQLIGRILS